MNPYSVIVPRFTSPHFSLQRRAGITLALRLSLAFLPAVFSSAQAQFRDALPTARPSIPKSVPDDLLPAEEAFKPTVRMVDAKTVEVRFSIAKGYLLYRDNFRFVAEGAKLGSPLIPPGVKKFDATFGKQMATLRDEVVIRLPASLAPGQSTAKLTVTSQGCADAGVCYPPISQRFDLVRAADKK
jgi:thiol:disulfide interchange protein